VEKNVPGVPHTVTFLSGGAAPEFILLEPQPAGPPKLLLNPAVLPPSPLPPAPYAGEGLFHSGFLFTGGPTPQEFTLAFSKPGTYKYLCLLHDPAGMNGTITVQ
jgi:plastocyanin